MLVTQADIEARLGRPLTDDEEARLPSLIADVTAYVTTYTRRAFTKEERTKVLRAQRGIIHLPDRPILSISFVKPLNPQGQPGTAIQSYAFDGVYKIRLYTDGYVINGPEWWDWAGQGNTFQTFQVKYESGYETIPADIASVAGNVVTNALLSSAMLGVGVSDVEQLRVGDVSYKFGSPGIGRVSAYLTDDDRLILNSYRGQGSTTFFEV